MKIMDATPSFLSRNDEDQQDDHVELQPPHAHHTPFPMYHPTMMQMPKNDLFNGIQWHLVVLGIIIGAILMSMRPVIIKGSAA